MKKQTNDSNYIYNLNRIRNAIFHFIDLIIYDYFCSYRIIIGGYKINTIAILMLAFGIGTNIMVFQIVHSIVIKKLPVDEPQNIFEVTGTPAMPVPLYQELEMQQNVVEGIFVSARLGKSVIEIDNRKIESTTGYTVNGDYFRSIGTRPHIGRLLTKKDDNMLVDQVVVISYKFWENEFARSFNAIGSNISINGMNVIVIGVTRKEFQGDRLGIVPDFWVTLSFRMKTEPIFSQRYAGWLNPMVRINPLIPIKSAEESLTNLYNKLIPTHGMMTSDDREALINLRSASNGASDITRENAHMLWIFMGIAVIVQMIICCNIAILFISKTNIWQQEIGIKYALGMPKYHILHQLIIEKIFLSIIGGAIGLWISSFGSKLVMNLILIGREENISMTINSDVIFFSIILSISSCFIFGIFSIILSMKSLDSKLPQFLKNSNPIKIKNTKKFLIVQMCLSMILVSGAVILTTSFINIENISGWKKEKDVLFFDTVFDIATLKITSSQTFRNEFNRRINEIPGVKIAALIEGKPLTGLKQERKIIPIKANNNKDFRSLVVNVTPVFFNTMSIPIITGTLFDTNDSTKVAIISNTVATKIFSNKNPVGEYFYIDSVTEPQNAIRVIGIIDSICFTDIKGEYEPLVFLPMNQGSPFSVITGIIKANNPNQFIPRIKEIVHEISPSVNLDYFNLWSNIIDSGVRREYIVSSFAYIYGIISLLLASLSICSITIYNISTRKTEIGIRIAVGASARTIRLMFIKETIIPLICALFSGSIISYCLIRIARAYIFGISDIIIYKCLLSFLVLTMVSLVSCYIPACKISKSNPKDLFNK